MRTKLRYNENSGLDMPTFARFFYSLKNVGLHIWESLLQMSDGKATVLGL